MVTDFEQAKKMFKGGDMDYIRKYRHKDGTMLQFTMNGSYKIEKGIIGFGHYEEVIEKYGKTMNQLNAEKQVVKIDNEVVNDFSYNGACSTTLSHLGYGFLEKNKAFVTRTLYGDGGYPAANNGEAIRVDFGYSYVEIVEELNVGKIKVPSGKILITDPCYIEDGDWNGLGVVVEVESKEAEIILCLDKEGSVWAIEVRPVKK